MYPPNSTPKDLSGFKSGFGTITVPGSESKTFAKSSILGDLKMFFLWTSGKLDSHLLNSGIDDKTVLMQISMQNIFHF
mgnify:CR=1 FL=1